MALSVTAIAPAVGHSGGKTLVEITGGDFQLPPTPAATGVVPEAAPTMRVLIDGVPATKVAVVDASTLYCLTPKGDPDAATPRDVVVQTIDTDGNVLQTATLAAAYSFQRPNINEEGELAHVLRAFIVDLRRQVLHNVNFSTHTDYDAETGEVTQLAYVQQLPALIIGDLSAPENRSGPSTAHVEYRVSGDRFVQRRPPRIFNMHFTITGVTDNPLTVLNLLEAVEMYFQKNGYVEVARRNGTTDTVQYEMRATFGEPVSVTHHGDDGKAKNVEAFTGQVHIRNIIVEDMPGLTKAKPPGFPADMAHEATVGVGWVSRNDAGAVQMDPAQVLEDPE